MRSPRRQNYTHFYSHGQLWKCHCAGAFEDSLSDIEGKRSSLGADNVEVRAMDASKASRVLPANSFSKVLLDAPCSGLGQRPRLQPGREVDIAAYASFQRKLLQEAMRLMTPGGGLVYSTCTVTPQGSIHLENEENVAWALENLPLKLKRQKILIGRNSGPENLCQFFDPSEWDLGFFIAS